ncbi:MAG: hypothetical protein KF908_05335 [Nitrosomonas sp.]|nr:hypothetical protein [Nitrosomonas sp.]
MKLTDEQLEEAKKLKQKFDTPRNGREINRAQFAKDNNLRGGGAMIYQHIKGIRPISINAAIAYAKGFDCSLDEISPRLANEARQSALLIEENKSPVKLTNIEETEKTALEKDVPLISWVQAGDWCEAINSSESGDAEDWLWCPVGHSDKTFALRVSGVSMFNPDPYARHTFKDGDIIYVDPNKQPINNSFVVVRLENENKATFKQLIIDGNHRFLRAINPDWPEKIIEIKNNAVICGVVIYKGSEV